MRLKFIQNEIWIECFVSIKKEKDENKNINWKIIAWKDF